MLDEFSTSEKKEKKAIVKKSILYNNTAIENSTIKSIDFYELKTYKQSTNSQIERLLEKKQKLENQNLKNLIDRKIKKLYFYLSTYTQQVFDLHFTSDSMTKYNFDLLHFDLFLKSENLSNQLLFYRLIDKAKSNDYSTFTFDDDFIKSQTFDKTEKNIIEKITNQIVLQTIAQHDKIKLDFLKIYYNKLYKHNKQKQAMTITRYKKYIIDRY